MMDYIKILESLKRIWTAVANRSGTDFDHKGFPKAVFTELHLKFLVGSYGPMI